MEDVVFRADELFSFLLTLIHFLLNLGQDFVVRVAKECDGFVRKLFEPFEYSDLYSDEA